MGAHSSTAERTARDVAHLYQGRHVDQERQPGRRTDGIPDEWFDLGFDRSPDDADPGVR